MIAPIKEPPTARRPSALQAARLAVADALLTPRRRGSAGNRSTLRRVWLLAGSLIVLAVAYLLTFDW